MYGCITLEPMVLINVFILWLNPTSNKWHKIFIILFETFKIKTKQCYFFYFQTICDAFEAGKSLCAYNCFSVNLVYT